MPAVTIRNIPPETHRAIKIMAAKNGRSAEAEMRAILNSAVKVSSGPTVAEILADLRRDFEGYDLEIERDQTPAGSTVDFG